MKLYTVGHSNREPEQFVQLLENHGVHQIFDVRRFPTSKKYPHFRREAMEKSLPEAGIEYHYLGDLLGGYRTGGYERYMQTEDFRRGIDALLRLAKDGQAALMCAEMLYFKCHRRFIADYLVREEGVTVLHIVDEKRVVPHTKPLL